VKIPSAGVKRFLKRTLRLRNDKNPPDRNRGEQLKTQAVNRLVALRQAQDIQEDRDLKSDMFIALNDSHGLNRGYHS
jgi:hypothetical protein